MSLLKHSQRANGSKSQESHADTNRESLASDAHLLAEFLKHKNEAAFADIVHRYGEMVFAVALRVVRDRHAAEDVTQATFLLLAKDVRKIRRKDSLSSWLHGVAIRLAKKAIRRRTREQVNDVVTELAVATESFEKIHSTFEQQVLDEELEKLPANYRDPLILHFLQGKTYEETAQLLGVTVGAIEGRLKRGKRELQLRLTKRGVGLGAALAALTWSNSAAAATVQPQLIQTITVNGIAAFQGTAFAPTCSPEAVYLAGKEATMLTTTKIATLTCGLFLAAGAGWLGHTGFAQEGSGSSGGRVIQTVVDDENVESDAANSTTLLAQSSPAESTDPFASAASQDDNPAKTSELDAIKQAIDALSKVDALAAQNPEIANQKQKAAVELRRLYEYWATQNPASQSVGQPNNVISIDTEVGTFSFNQVPFNGKIEVERNLSPLEEKIEEALSQQVNFEFVGNPLSDVVDFLSQNMQVPILIDEQELSEEGLSGDDEVELVLSGIPASDALDLILEPLGLTYVIEKSVLRITTMVKADETLITRVYDVRPLNIKEPESLADVLMTGTSGEWLNEDGAGGEISYIGGSFVVRQTRRVHDEVETLLNQLAKQMNSGNPNPEWPTKSRPSGQQGGMQGGGFGGGGMMGGMGGGGGMF